MELFQLALQSGQVTQLVAFRGIAIRYKIENLVFDLLGSDKLRNAFLDTKTTREKLGYCVRHGVIVPEIYFLLGIIYNSPLHLNQGQDISAPLSLKLENLTIKKMITDLFEN